jgi:hypothetical protein
MAKIKYDVSDVEVQEDRDFSTPVPRGVYTVRLTECEHTTANSSGNPMLKATLEIEDNEELSGRLLWDNIVLIDSTEWKLAQFIRALGLKDKATLDTDRIIGTVLKARVKHETYLPEGEPESERRTVAKVAALLPMPDDEDEPDEADEPDDDSEPEDEPEDDATDDDDASEEAGDDDDDDDVPPYSEWSITELSAEIKERGLRVATKKKGAAKKKYLVQKLEQDDEADSEGDDGDQPF